MVARTGAVADLNGLEVPLVKLSGTIVDRRSARNAVATGHSNDTAVPTLFTRALASSRLPVSLPHPNFRRDSSKESTSVGIIFSELQAVSLRSSRIPLALNAGESLEIKSNQDRNASRSFRVRGHPSVATIIDTAMSQQPIGEIPS